MARQQYGTTPWGRWFIDVLDSYNLGDRLGRGKTIANTGKVLSFDIDEDTVTAKVAGNYSPFYKVQIEFPILDADSQTEIVKIIKNNPAILSDLVQGNLPIEFLELLKSKKIDLIPNQWGQMRKKCNCLDDVGTCKHIAALYFVLTRHIDADPYILFTLRGIDLKSIAAQYGAEFEFKLQAPFVIKQKDVSINSVKKHLIPLDLCGQTSIKTNNTKIELTKIPDCMSFITSLLPPKPVFCSESDFTILLLEFYHGSMRYSPWLSLLTSEDDEQVASRSIWSIECNTDDIFFGEKSFLQNTRLVQVTVQGSIIKHSVYDAFVRFSFFSNDDGTDSYTFLFYLFKFLNLVIGASAFFPYPVLKEKHLYGAAKRKSKRQNEGQSSELGIIWMVLNCVSEIAKISKQVSDLECNLLLLDKEKNIYASGDTVVDLLSSLVLTDYVKHVCFVPSGGSISLRELSAIFFNGATIDVSSPAMKSTPTSIARWLTVLNMDFCAYQYVLTLKDYAQEGRGDVATTAFKLSMDVFIDDKKLPLKDAAKLSSNIEVLKAPTALSNYLPQIKVLCEKKDVRLNEKELVNFLDGAADMLAMLGIKIVFPKNLHRELKPRLVLTADTKEGANKKTKNLVSYLDLPSLLTFNWQVSIGDTVLNAAEFSELLKQKKSVVKFKNKYIRIDPVELAALLKSAQNGTNKINSANDFLHNYFSGDSVLSFDAEKIIEKIFCEKHFDKPAGLNASLRDYQMRGFNWICSLLYAGFGCILADDMGLGKTVQSISVLLHLKEAGMLRGRCLIVAPAALLENWEREINKFAPALCVYRYHGGGRSLNVGVAAKQQNIGVASFTYAAGAQTPIDVFLTTYQTAVRDKTKLIDSGFSMLIIDEAHLIKNADTRAAKSIKEINAVYKLALTGTPVENRLEDMRSIFDFIIPGYMGTQNEFRDQYRIPIEIQHSKEKAAQLQKITSPFLLRRLKTDKDIIADLPDKITTNEYSVLEKEQAALYESVISDSLEKLEQLKQDANRNAMVLTLLTSLKQICDHPRVYDKESPPVSALSGKCKLLLALLDNILKNGEKVLIFSQYVETLQCLYEIIKREAGEESLIYHGGMPQDKRSAIVDSFQNNNVNKIMLVSLRAGGLGLNLTAASQVVHYDLWYNPAVEAQATDRVFRIGQKRNVFVHRFITKNTFEEKIDTIISSKKELANMSVQSGESWLSKMSQTELKELFGR
ncbi:MAG: DEAD/DEAH box helicase [Termitinemataceae bacterium]|nr:MAG: DEAD/DEAH box helicase [Termitinemataceae bacterium]